MTKHRILLNGQSYQVLEEIPKEQSMMPFRHFPSPLILRKNNNDDQNTFFHLVLDPSDMVGNVCIDARCGLGMDNFRRKKGAQNMLTE